VIIFFEWGKLGNQLFQYRGLRKHFPEHKIIFFGCEELKNYFDNVLASFVIFKPHLKKLSFYLLRNFFLFLVKLKLIGEITSISKNEHRLNIYRGLFLNIYFAHSIFFQHNHYIKKDLVEFPIIKNKFLNFSKEWLKKKKIFFYRKRLVFVHIRRGDYLIWPSTKFPAAVKLSWYKKSMLKIGNKIKKPIFIIMGDDLSYIRSVFKENSCVIISNNETAVDLAIMSMCSHGILSPSSFAWWGAFFARSANTGKNFSYFIAIKYWAGQQRKKWFPRNFRANWITYIK
jgi:hypothetical protein